MSVKPLITCLWFDGTAEQAAEQYTSIFKNSKLGRKTYYLEAGKECHGQEPGSVMTVEFELNGQKFVGLNGGPMFKHNEAVSFQVDCEDQAEVDYYWDKLGQGGDEARRVCGWIADRYGVAWQVVPKVLKEMLDSEDKEAAGRVTVEMMGMKKMDIERLRSAFEGRHVPDPLKVPSASECGR
ncbi:unnamed protein product [Clonostachys rhizophaga]|uniref:PhnB-like domain-containing protein n=1 Tax=Clonostachys rhizophaga TaxID=160324 RepID=A0A9N9YMD8_9HYPO|nr:unnamed protein product [Clonostachys rhizophaga]